MPDTSSQPLRVAVVTGGHSFDVLDFHELFHTLPNIRPVIQHLDDWCSSPPTVRAAYDVVVFYTMILATPADTGLPWYAGKQLTALSEFGTTPQGIVVLHHGLVAFPQWPLWSDLVGIPDRANTAHWEGGPITATLADPGHPITAGLPASFTLADESYTLADPTSPAAHPLLTTTHKPSMRTLAWTHTYKNARVFCYQSGHGAPVYRHPTFRTLLTHGIEWTARRR